jgi:hypothetical protein
MGILLAACAVEQPLTSDLVKDRAAAIQRYANECVGISPEHRERMLKKVGWHTVFSKGKWHVWLGNYGCPFEEGEVQAADGKTACMVCVS